MRAAKRFADIWMDTGRSDLNPLRCCLQLYLQKLVDTMQLSLVTMFDHGVDPIVHICNGEEAAAGGRNDGA